MKGGDFSARSQKVKSPHVLMCVVEFPFYRLLTGLTSRASIPRGTNHYLTNNFFCRRATLRKRGAAYYELTSRGPRLRCGKWINARWPYLAALRDRNMFTRIIKGENWNERFSKLDPHHRSCVLQSNSLSPINGPGYGWTRKKGTRAQLSRSAFQPVHPLTWWKGRCLTMRLEHTNIGNVT